jgi:hypothetical protein
MPSKMGMRDEDKALLHRLMMTPYVLPALKEKLNLTAEQAVGMEAIKLDMKSKNRDLAEKVAAKQKDFDATVAANKTPSREHFRELATGKADLQFNLADAGAKMRAALTDGQRATFKAMTMADLHGAMMANVSEMHELMQAMGEMPMGHMMDGGMMKEGMMKGGMSKGGMTQSSPAQDQAAPAGHDHH